MHNFIIYQFTDLKFMKKIKFNGSENILDKQSVYQYFFTKEKEQRKLLKL